MVPLRGLLTSSHTGFARRFGVERRCGRGVFRVDDGVLHPLHLSSQGLILMLALL